MILVQEKLHHSKLEQGKKYSKEEILSEINRLKKLRIIRDNGNKSKKIILNSIYGVLGFKKFILYERRVAESVTTQSRSLIKYTINITNYYFKELFPKDKALLAKIGCTVPAYHNFDTVHYADTDSIMVVFDKIYKNVTYTPSYDETIAKVYKVIPNYNNPDYVKLEFILKVYHYGLINYYSIMLDKFCEKYGAFTKRPNGKPSFKLALEQINYSILWVAKKMYIKNSMWSGKIINDRLKSLSFKGIDINKKSTPKYVREQMKRTIEFIMDSGIEMNTDKLVKLLKEIKDQFTTTNNISNISFFKKVNNYNKYVISDTTELKLVSGCPEHVRAAAVYNYLLYNSNYKSKYPFIKSGNKIQYYHSQNGHVFGFFPGFFPAEIAMPINYEAQFEAVFLNPMNNILSVLGIPKINAEILLFGGIW
jgi:DNA polymerase elongation subunit (family B)